MTNPLTLSQVAQQNEGYLNAEVEATCLAITAKKSNRTGKNFWVVKLGEQAGAETMESSMFAPPKFGVGDVVIFSGQGIKFSRDNFGAKLSVSEKTIITKLGASVHHEEQQERRAESRPAVNGTVIPVPGPTVGMAINNALTVLTKDLSHDELIARLIAPTFWSSVHEVASDVIRVSRMLEAGKLAPSMKDRTENNSISYTPRTPDRSPAPAPALAKPGTDEDVPF